ncbi:dr1-associated corepressor-like [Scleropages formosus]|uniref:Dr1-associated corepressor n=1 Tax=Scleropages formosus TaxID=113540 RepID=A0A0P7UWP6_SCLFO|nr:dr1-associated corepressor-like [Scleropages formosus]
MSARIKKIMQTDEEIGKVAAAVPVIISRALELFLESLLTKACQVTQSRNAKTMTTSHLKHCIELEQQFDFLKDLVAAVPDMQGDSEDNHTEGGEKVSRRGRKPGSGRKNGGASTKGKDKKQSGTESEQEEDSEDSETEGEEEDGSRSSSNMQAATRFQGVSVPSPYVHMGATQGGLGTPLSFVPAPSLLGSAPPPPACLSGDNDEDDEDYDS